jgi:hypothetical protein
MFNGKSGSSGLETGLNNKNPQTGLNPAESLQSSLVTGYKNTLVGIYTGESTQEQAKAKIEDFSLVASKKVETFKKGLQELAQEKAVYKKDELDQKQASDEVDTLLSIFEDDDGNQTTASDIYGADRIYGTS